MAKLNEMTGSNPEKILGGQPDAPAAEENSKAEPSDSSRDGQEAAAAAQTEAAGQEQYQSLEDFGRDLAEQRLAQGLSLDDVAEKLKLNKPVVQAMESGQIAKDRPVIYVRGFLRAYAQAMKIPQSRYEKLLSSLVEKTELLQRPYYRAEKTARLPHKSPLLGILASLLITVCAVWAVWHFKVIDYLVSDNGSATPKAVPMQTYETEPLEPLPQQTVTVAGTADKAAAAQDGKAEQNSLYLSASSGQAAAPAAADGTVRGSVQGPAQGAAQAVQGAVQAPVKTDGSSAQPQAQGQSPSEQEYLPAVVPPNSPWAALQGNATLAGQAGLATQPPADQQAPSATSPVNPNLPPNVQGMVQDGKHTLTVTAEEACWTQVRADSGRPAQRTLQPGESMTVPFETSLKLQLGNAGGVKVYYDGIEQTNRGRKGQVRTMDFPPKAAE